MAEPVVLTSPTEFFRDLVEAAMQNQRVTAYELTTFYVVNLLTAFVHVETSPTAGDEEPLGVGLARALQTAGLAQRAGLRKVGDLSLFISGFFSDSLNRRLVDIDYYIQLGECAYGSLAKRDEALGDVFEELSEKFTAFVDIIGEVSESTRLTSNADVLRMYEKWMRTRSRRSGDLLAAHGIVPNSSAASRFIQ